MIINEILQNAFSNIERDLDSYIEVNGIKYGSKDLLKDLKVNIKADKEGVWIGRAIPKMLNAEIINNGITINAGDEIKPYFGVKIGDVYQYINVGIFYAQNPEYTEDRKLIKIVAYDKLKMAQSLEYGTLTYPVTVTKVVDLIASKLEIAVDKTNLLFLDYNIEKEVYFGKDKTVIELINAIAQMSMTFAYLDYDNVLKFKRPNKVTKTLNDDNVFKFRFKDFQKQYNSLVISRQPQNDDVALKVDNNQLENIEMKLSNNPILDLNREFFITDLLNTAKVIPAYNGLENLTMQSNPLLEVGDIVTFREKDVVILEHEITMTRSMLKSQIAEKTETDYKKSKGVENLAINTELYVDKVKNEIVATIGDEVGNKLTELKLDEAGITQRVESVFEANKDSLQGEDGAPGNPGKDGQDAYIPSTTPPTDTSRYWMDLNENKLKYFDKTTNTWKDVNWQLEERIQTAESKVTDSAIIDKVTKSEQWTTLSDKANNALDAVEVQKKIDEFSTNELTSDKLMTKISNTTTWTNLNNKLNSKVDATGVNTSIKSWADQTLTTSYFNTQFSKTTGFTDLSGKYTDVEKRTSSLELNLKDFQLEFNKETSVNLNLISRTEDFSKAIPDIGYAGDLFVGTNGTLLRLYDPSNNSTGGSGDRWEFKFNKEVKLTGQTFWLSMSAKAGYSSQTKVNFRLAGGDGTWSNAELLGTNLGDFRYIRLKVVAPNSGATCRGIYVNIYNTAGVSQNAIEIQSKTLKCEIGRNYTAWSSAETDEIKGANYYFGLDVAKFIYNNEDVLKVDPTNGLYIKGNGEFTGKLSATSGDIAGWSINNGWLRANGNNGSYVQLDSRPGFNSIQIGNAGGTTFTVSDTGEVRVKGRIEATSGTIGNFAITQVLRSIGGSNGAFIQLDGRGTGNFIQAGDNSNGSKFAVSPDGSMRASGATISGNITATSGVFSDSVKVGQFTISSGRLVGNGITLDPRGEYAPINVGGSYIKTNGYGNFGSGSFSGGHSGTGSFSSGSYTGSVYSGGGTLGGTSYSNDSGLSFSGSIWVGGLSSNGTVRGSTVSSSSFTSGVRNGSGQLVTATLNSGGWSISNSDIRLKENIEDLGHEFDNFIYDLPLIKYNYIGDVEMTPQAGVNANYLMKILPEYMAKSFLHQDKNTGLYGAKYELLVPYLIKTIQDLNNRVKELEVG